MTTVLDGFALPVDNRNGPNCGVTAVAVAARIPYAQAVQLMRGISGHRRKRWSGVTTHIDRVIALQRLGVPFVEVPVKRQRLETWVTRNAACAPQKTFMVRVRGHVMMVKGWRVLDQCGVCNVFKHGSKGKFVTTVTEILGQEITL